MRILLTTVKAPERSPFSILEKIQPMGIGVLVSILKNEGHEICFFDPYTDPKDTFDLYYLIFHKIDVIGIYICTMCWKEILELLEKIQTYKDNGWNGKVIVGGPHTYAHNKQSDYPKIVDHVVVGEAELVINDLIVNGSPDRIIFGNNPTNLDDLPIASYEIFEGKPYLGYGSGGQVYAISTSRGCPHNCIFCSSSSATGRHYRWLSAERMIEHIRFIEERYKIGYLQFRENNFCVNNQRVYEFCKLYIELGFKYPWYAEGSVKDLSLELLQEMKNAHCSGIYIGFESASERILDVIKPGLKHGFTPEKNEQVANWCNQVGLRMFATYLIGLPFEEEVDIQKTVDFVKKFNSNGTNWFCVYVGIPGSRLYDDVKDLWHQDDIGLRYGPHHNELCKRFYGEYAERSMI